jgi:hypothetical protein
MVNQDARNMTGDLLSSPVPKRSLVSSSGGQQYSNRENDDGWF